MARRAGSADLPLHGGRVPPWLTSRMSSLGAIITQAIVHHYGRDEFLQRLSHPFWFQSFGAVMGMDWHSSGITTSVIGALKRGLEPLRGELGIHVCGGRGQHSRKTPQELIAVGDRVGIDGERLATASNSCGVARECLPRPPQTERPSSPCNGLSPRLSAPSTLVVMPEECQSIPITAPNDWNQNGCARRASNSSRP